MTDIVQINDLRIEYRTAGTPVTAVHGVDLAIGRGQTVALVGESGSGKSTVASAIIGLLAGNARITAGSVLIDGDDVTHWPESQRRRLRGRKIGYVPQDPLVGLNPTTRVGKQIAEAVIQARGTKPKGALRRAVDDEVIALLEQVGIDRPALRARQYPHELSGGMRQRALIAIALAGDPELIIADEPTSALDATVQKRILDHLAHLARERGISLLLITHDLGVAADRADEVIVLQQGRIVEAGVPADILVAPTAAYTKALLAAAPSFSVTEPPRPGAADAAGLRRGENVTPGVARPRGGGAAPSVRARDDVSFEVRTGETLGIVGESGSGKTTLLRTALALETPTAGTVRLDGQVISGVRWSALRPLRRRIQLVQQNPYASLDPRYTVFESIVEPLVSFGEGRRRDHEARARELIDVVHLPQSYLNRLPRELSGGQRQRVAIARALALRPELVFLDEPVSALDVSVQAQILALLRELQEALGVAYVLVSHDLAVVSNVAHRVVVLQQGKVVEEGATADVFAAPRQDYTRELLAAIPGRSHAGRTH